MEAALFNKLYDMEGYLFEVVGTKFKDSKSLSAFDFFCIVIWKANRAKSKIAKKLLAQYAEQNGIDDFRSVSLDNAVKMLADQVLNAPSDKDRMKVLVADWKFGLPMASAILTVLFPTSFTVYDIRVCRQLEDFFDADTKTKFESKWQRYEAYRQAVITRAPDSCASLREKDRYFWAKSFAEDLKRDIEDRFFKSVQPPEEAEEEG